MLSIQVTGKRLKKQNREVTKFISSLASDKRISKHVLMINMAHVLALHKSGYISKEDTVSILRFLNSFKLSDELDEDIHYMLERHAIDKLGIKVAGQMNLGKSRNDQVATAIRMELRDTLIRTMEQILSFQDTIIRLSRKYVGTIIPGYTHMQRAQPVLLSYHLLSYFDSLSRTFDRFVEIIKRVNMSPMGSAALAGTTIGLDRRIIADFLGFEGIVRNGIDSVSSRDFAVESIASAILLSLDLSRLSEEIIIWSTEEFRFVELPDEMAATSSIMPQKKNPVVSEIVRARSSFPLSSLVSSFSIIKCLPYSYNLDLQEVTPLLWTALDTVIDSLRMTSKLMDELRFRQDFEKELSEGYTCAAFLAEYLSTKKGINFRVSHAVVGELVSKSQQRGISFRKAAEELLSEIARKYTGKRIILSGKEIGRILNPKEALRMIKTEGGCNPDKMEYELKLREGIIEKQRKTLSLIKSRIKTKLSHLEREVSGFVSE